MFCNWSTDRPYTVTAPFLTWVRRVCGSPELPCISIAEGGGSPMDLEQCYGEDFLTVPGCPMHS